MPKKSVDLKTLVQQIGLQISSKQLIEVKKSVRKYRKLLVFLLSFSLLVLTLNILIPLFSPTQQVLVAADDLAQGSIITAEQTKIVHYPKHLVPEKSFSKLAELENLTIISAVDANSPITAANVFTEESALDESLALTNLVVDDPTLFEALKVGNVLHITCKMEFENKSAQLEAKIHSISDFSAQNGLGAGFNPSQKRSVLVQIPKAELATMAHCTPPATVLLAIIG